MSNTTASFQIFQETRDSLSAVLTTLARIAEERGETVVIDSYNQESSRQPLAEILRDRAENVRKKLAFRLAVVGEFNVGKSTLINALLKRKILSVARQPTTAAITTLRYGEPERFRVSYLPQYQQQHSTFLQDSKDLLQDIAIYTSDPAHIGDDGRSLLRDERSSLAEEIKEVEVWCTADFLRDQEIEIIDTPGLGSVFESHKTVTYALIPEVDATLFLCPPNGVDKADIAFLKFLREYVNQMLFVMTKAEYARDRKELEEMLHFNRQAIATSVPNVNIEQIYPVSAAKELDGEYAESGFSEFTQALQNFLVKSSGTARLQVPLQVARLNWTLLQQGVENEIELANQSLSDVQQTREKLAQQQQLIIQRQQGLKKYITTTIEDMIHDAMQGIDVLSTQIQIVVERQIDAYGWQDLLKADRYVPTIIKEEIDTWFSEKEQRFQSKAQLLQRRIEDDLRTILEMLQATTTTTNRQEHSDLVTPQIKGVFTKGVLQLTQSTVWNTGLAFTTGIGFTGLLWGIAISPLLSTAPAATLIAPPLLALIPFLFAARKLVQETVSFKRTLANNIKDAMRKNMPHNSINVYQAVIEGYIDDRGLQQPGLREILIKSFGAWADELKKNVEFVVVNNLDRFQNQIEQRIAIEARGHWVREEELKKLSQQHEDLLITDKQLIELETIIEKLSTDGLNSNPSEDS
ncbi:MAG: dynamin family protein [Aulosira sp. DedQUE10]|nr:dynamin family protein [Aulosira sp. DedQUE10]